jgi:hypothetical protein
MANLQIPAFAGMTRLEATIPDRNAVRWAVRGRVDSRFRGNDMLWEARVKKAVIPTQVGVDPRRGFPLSRE